MGRDDGELVRTAGVMGVVTASGEVRAGDTIRIELPAGEYQTACKPGMVGDGIRNPLTVTGEAAQLDEDE